MPTARWVCGYRKRTARRARRYAHGWSGSGYTRSEEHTSELQSLMRISYAVFCLKKKKDEKITNELKENNQNIKAANPHVPSADIIKLCTIEQRTRNS